MPAQPAPSVQQQAVNAQNLPPVKVALLLPLSGKNRDLGQSMLQAAQLALFSMGYPAFQLMPHDSKATPDGARDAAEAAIAEGSQLILGPLFSAEVKAVKPVAGSHGINVVAFSTDWAQAGGNTFVMGFLPFSQVQRIVEYAASHGYHRIGLIAPVSDYGNAVTGFYQALISRHGLQTAPVAHIPPGKGGMPGLAETFMQNGLPMVDAVLIAVGGEQAAAVSAQLTAAGLGPDQVKRLGTGLWDESTLSSNPDFRGAWYAAPQPDARRAFEKKYWDTYPQAPPRLATLSYDATALAAVLARNGAARNIESFGRIALSNPNGFSGIDGIFRFRQDGMIDRGMAVLQMNSGAVVVIDQAPKTFQRMAY